LTFALDKLNVRHISTSGLVDHNVQSVSRDAHLAMKVSTQFEVDTLYIGIERWRKSFTTIVLGDHDFLLIASFLAI